MCDPRIFLNNLSNCLLYTPVLDEFFVSGINSANEMILT